LVLAGLGTVWILDGLEVTIVGAVGSTLTKAHSGISITTAQVGDAAGVYVAGACLGALVFGYLTDKLGRKKLFLVTLGVYLVATVLTGISTNAWMFFAFRFFTGMGIGGEYAAINSAIDELIPARVRGTVDLVVNGSYWLGTAAGAAATLLLLDPKVLAVDVGWRVCFLMGAVLGLGIMFVRRTIPESPRWLMTHGKVDEAEQIVDGIEQHVQSSTGQDLPEPDDTEIEIKPQESVGLLDMARTVFGSYPKRTVLGLSLFVGQAFLYNAVFFTYALVLTTFYKVDSSSVGFYLIAFAVGNFLGPLILGRLFDNVGRRPMIAGTYILSGVMLAITAWLFDAGTLTATTQTIAWVVIFFFASAGASAAYLTVSEIYPMETRAIAIALFYAVGTGLGGIIGPVLFGHLIATKHPFDTAIGYLIGGGLMFAAGVVEIFLGVDAEQKSLEDIASPITAAETDTTQAAPTGAARAPAKLPRNVRPYPYPAQSGRFGRYDLRPGSTAVRETHRRVTDREIDIVIAALRRDGPASMSALAGRVGARYWGPGRLREVLREARARNEVVRQGRDTYAATDAPGST
jgi:MFS family permease